MMSDLLEIKNLQVNFFHHGQTIEAVRGAALSVRQGEVLVLAGESGSGKTITALSIARILPPEARIMGGTISFDGADMLALSEKELVGMRGSRIAYVFQEPTSFLNPVYTIGSQLMETIMLHQPISKAKAFEEAVKLLGMVKLKDSERLMYSYPHQLSGGMNQRVFIAMSIACKPNLLIADEPTTALDVSIERDILKLLVELKQRLQFSLLFITHNLAIAERIADRVAVMYQGEVVEIGRKEEIFNSARHFHTKELLSAYERIGKI
jgi:ABC-type dipeptide/oligopeptide/nickel transport system ATPase component